MSMLLGLLRAYWLPLALAAVAATLGWRLHSEQAAHAIDVATFESERTRYANEARAAEAAQRDIERQRQATVDAAKDALATALADNRALAASLDIARTDVGRVRRQLSTFAAPASGQAGSDTTSACQARATALAEAASRGVELLVEGRFLLRDIARERDDFAAEVTACVNGWPAESSAGQARSE